MSPPKAGFLSKQLLADAATPLARAYIRNSPVRLFKASLWRSFHWRTRDFIAKTRFGQKLEGNTSDLIQRYIYFFGVWEPSLTHFLMKRLNGLENRTFIDVGANIGYFSLLASACMPKGNIVAVEAFPATYDKLLRNTQLNRTSNIRAVNCAATDSTRELKIYHAGPSNEGATTTLEGRFSSTPISVQGMPLPKILNKMEIQSTRLIKIDVEGAEREVIMGMKSIIPSFPKDIEIVTEISPNSSAPGNNEEIFDLFQDHGFFPYELDNKYDPESYIFAPPPKNPTRLHRRPRNQMDVVFSRIDNEFLR